MKAAAIRPPAQSVMPWKLGDEALDEITGICHAHGITAPGACDRPANEKPPLIFEVGTTPTTKRASRAKTALPAAPRTPHPSGRIETAQLNATPARTDLALVFEATPAGATLRALPTLWDEAAVLVVEQGVRAARGAQRTRTTERRACRDLHDLVQRANGWLAPASAIASAEVYALDVEVGGEAVLRLRCNAGVWQSVTAAEAATMHFARVADEIAARALELEADAAFNAEIQVAWDAIALTATPAPVVAGEAPEVVVATVDAPAVESPSTAPTPEAPTTKARSAKAPAKPRALRVVRGGTPTDATARSATASTTTRAGTSPPRRRDGTGTPATTRAAAKAPEASR